MVLNVLYDEQHASLRLPRTRRIEWSPLNEESGGGDQFSVRWAYLSHIDFFLRLHFTGSPYLLPSHRNRALSVLRLTLFQKMDDVFEGAIGIDLGTTYS